jgi:HEAT repeat protein
VNRDCGLSGIRALLLLLVGIGVLVPLGGCMDTPSRTGDPLIDLKSADDPVKVLAAQEACRTRDPATVPLLIALLSDREPWVRYNAHVALILISGHNDFGYNYVGSKIDRSAGIKKYRAWYEETGGVQPPAGEPEPTNPT